jgi:hypothetical protein
MALIRTKRIDNNAGGRDGCQVMSPRTGAIVYVTVERRALVVRDFNGKELARDPDPVTLVPSGTLSGDFAAPGQLCVTVSGFPSDTNQSGIDTYLLPVPE